MRGTAIRSTRSGLSFVLLWAMTVGLALSSLLSPGVMPLRDAHGGLVLVLCTGDGPVAMVMDPVTGETRPQMPDTENHCAWATAHPVAGPDTGILPIAPLWQLAATLGLPGTLPHRASTAALEPSARGPPASA